jgi:YhcH/YjgK/YiaL family protein
MICDRLDNAAWYSGLPRRIVRALEFLRDNDPLSLALGRLDVDGDRLFALVQEYTTRDESECRWEAHRRYCDVQYVASGVERIDVAHIADMQVVELYDAAKDVAFFSGAGDSLTLRAGAFAIFAPQDVHRPCVAAFAREPVRKIVLKALIE